MSILRKAGVSAVTVDPSTSVLRAVGSMKEGGVDTLFVVEEGALRGAFTQRDLAFRVVLDRRDPEVTTVGEVMTSPAIEVGAHATIADATGAAGGSGEPASSLRSDDETGRALPPPTAVESLVSALLEAGPEVAEHVVRAAQELLLAAQCVVDAVSDAVHEQQDLRREQADADPTTGLSDAEILRHLDVAE